MPSSYSASGTALKLASANPNNFDEGFEDPEALQEEQRIEELRKFRDTDQAKRLISWVHSEYQKMNSSREREKQQWQLNLAFYNKLQNSKMGKQGLYVPPTVQGKRKIVVNRIRATVRTEIAKLTSQKPGISVVPSSTDGDDLFAASAGEDVFRAVAERAKLQREYAKSCFWLSITGNGFIKTYWDNAKLDVDSDIYGDVAYESVSPFNLFVPDIREEEIENQSFVLHMYTKPVEWVKRFYEAELDGEKITPSSVTSDTLLESSYLKTSDGTRKPDSCMIYEMWLKPGAHADFPNGGFLILIDHILVSYSASGLPYGHGMYPFSHIKGVPSGKFYGVSVIEDLTDLQTDYNDNVNLISETRRKMGKAQILAQKGSISAAKITNEIGLVIEYKPGMPPPTPMPLSELPSYISQEQQRLLTDIEDISGQHQVSKGSAPPGVTAATAISFLQEKDDSYMVPTFQSVEQAYEKIGRLTLSLAVEFWDTPRLIKIAGSESEFDVMELTGAQIANGTDLRIEPGSALPQSKAARSALITDLMNAGHIDSATGLELMELGGSQKIMDTIKLDKRQAQRENIKMRSVDPSEIEQIDAQWEQIKEQHNSQLPEGPDSEAFMLDDDTVDPATGMMVRPIAVPVNDFDNHEVHIETHNNFRKSQGYANLSQEIKDLFDAHVKAHEQAMQGSMLKQLLSQIPTDGTVPGMPGIEGGPDGEEGAEAPAEGEAAEPSTQVGSPSNMENLEESQGAQSQG